MDFLKSVARGLCLLDDPGLVDLQNAIIFSGLTVGVTLVMAFIPIVVGIVLGL